MYQIRSRYNDEENAFKDIDLLGSFIDNHDNARFLGVYGNDVQKLKNALVFSMTARGIPFFYYGDEQGYAGGNDPDCRESLWPNYNTDSELFKLVKFSHSKM